MLKRRHVTTDMILHTIKYTWYTIIEGITLGLFGISWILWYYVHESETGERAHILTHPGNYALAGNAIMYTNTSTCMYVLK